MADPAPAAAPAPAAVSPAVAQRFANLDDLVRINVYGKEQTVPVRLAAEGYQTKEASRQAIDAANKIKAEAHVDHEHAERWRILERQLQLNPEEAFRNLERLAGVSRQAPGSDPAIEATPPTSDRKTSDLEARIRELESGQNQTVLRGRIKEALDSTELTRTNAEARALAETQLLAYQIVDGKSDPMDNMADVHTKLLKVLSPAATQQRDQRADLQRTMPNIPASVGMPDLSDIPQGTAADLKNGSMRTRILEAAKRFGGNVAGNY